MFGYAPQVTDRSGELQAAGQLKGAEGIASGIQSLGQNAGSIIGYLGKYNQDTKAADGAASLAHDLGIMDDTAFSNFSNMDRDSRVGAMGQLLPMFTAKGNMDMKNAMFGLSQQRLNQGGAGGTESKITSF
jgi:hypothetical protein